jgi:hypothetical protein
MGEERTLKDIMVYNSLELLKETKFQIKGD